jgi:hypothetical protein
MVHDHDFDRYESVIHTTDMFWDLRYPETIAMSVTLRLGFKPPPGEIIAPKPFQYFEVVVDDIDRLVAVISKKACRNPAFYKHMIGTEARNYLAQLNKNRHLVMQLLSSP